MNSNANSHQPAADSRSLLGPNWRWRLAERRVATRAARSDDPVDETITAAAEYLSLLRRSDDEDRAARRQPQVAAARLLWSRPEAQQQLTIMVLGDFPVTEIAQRLGVPANLVEMTEQLFLDIRDMRQATSWIEIFVIRPRIKAGDGLVAIKYRLAFTGGRLLAETLLDAPQRIGWDRAEQLIDEERLLHMKVREALEIPLTDDRSAMQLLKVYTDWDYRRRQLQLREQQFRHRCQQDLLRQQLPQRGRMAEGPGRRPPAKPTCVASTQPGFAEGASPPPRATGWPETTSSLRQLSWTDGGRDGLRAVRATEDRHEEPASIASRSVTSAA